MPRRSKIRFSDRRSCATSRARGGGHTGRMRAMARADETGTFSQSKVTTSTPRAKRASLREVIEAAGDDVGDGCARHVAAAVVHREPEPERDPGEGHHPAELAGADDADAHGGLQFAAGSGRARTSAVCRSRNARERVAQRRVLRGQDRGGEQGGVARPARRSRPSRQARRPASARSRAASRGRSAPSTGSARRSRAAAFSTLSCPAGVRRRRRRR